MVTSSPIALALGFERAGPDIMQDPPRSKETSLFTRELSLDTMVYGCILGGLSLVSFILVTIIHKVPSHETNNCIRYYDKNDHQHCEIIYKARYYYNSLICIEPQHSTVFPSCFSYMV